MAKVGVFAWYMVLGINFKLIKFIFFKALKPLIYMRCYLAGVFPQTY
jgi:hypothetical protein